MTFTRSLVGCLIFISLTGCAIKTKYVLLKPGQQAVVVYPTEDGKIVSIEIEAPQPKHKLAMPGLTMYNDDIIRSVDDVRKILDEAGMQDVPIFTIPNIDESL